MFGESNKNKPVSPYLFEVVGTVEEDKGGKGGAPEVGVREEGACRLMEEGCRQAEPSKGCRVRAWGWAW